MLIERKITIVENYSFYNLTYKDMSFDDVFEKIISFINQHMNCTYRLAIGTDAQVHKTTTKFITAIHIHRIRTNSRNGAWGCLQKRVVNRRITSLREKISTETAISQETACLFTPKHIDKITDTLISSEDDPANLEFSIHLDIGNKGATKSLIKEMTKRIEAMGIEAKIKPDSYAASSYANKYTR